MTTQEAKEISIVTYLQNIGVEPKRKSGWYRYYNAPYREDKTPSFAVYENNKWFDFATGEKGDLIDLVKRIHNCDFRNAIKIIENQTNYTGNTPINRTEHRTREGKEKVNDDKKEDENKSIAILKETSLCNEALTNYLRERKIDIKVAKKYCREIFYSSNNKRYFSIAFKNDKGGYEIRNKYFKGAVKSKEITTIVGKNGAQESGKCVVFEGFMDFLSYLTINKVSEVNGTVIVLNSIVNIDKAKENICKHRVVECYLDNDKGGKETVEKMKQWGVKENIEVVDRGGRYEGYKDVNEYLMNSNIKVDKSKTLQVK